MAIQVEEKFESPQGWTSGNNAGGDLVFIVFDDGDAEIDRDEALAALIAGTIAELTIAGRTVFRQASAVDPLSLSTWIGVVKYGVYQAPDGEATEYSFDIGTSTQHITHSKQTVGSYTLSGVTAIDFKQAINCDITYDDDGTTIKSVDVNGVDITVPIYSFMRTRWVDADDVTDTYKDKLMNLVAHTNAAAFEGHEIGEVIFMGTSGSMTKKGIFSGKYQLNEKFMASPNLTGIAIGGITGIDKGGWHYLWGKTGIDPSTKLPRTEQINVERVYDPGNFSDLEP